MKSFRVWFIYAMILLFVDYIKLMEVSKKVWKCSLVLTKAGILFWKYFKLNIFHHQPSLDKNIFFYSSFTSAEKSLIATEEHFLFLVTFLFLSYLHIPNHSPKVYPYSTSITGILFWAASPLTTLRYAASLQFLATITYLALTF